MTKMAVIPIYGINTKNSSFRQALVYSVIFNQVLYDLCLYQAQISGECLQDHWSSGLTCSGSPRKHVTGPMQCDFVCVGDNNLSQMNFHVRILHDIGM